MARRTLNLVLTLAVGLVLASGVTPASAATSTMVWTVTPLTADGFRDSSPQVSGDRVVWMRERSGARDIYTWALGDAAPTHIGTRTGDEWRLEHHVPRVSGDRVVWDSFDGNDCEIYMWVLGDATPQNISNRDGVDDIDPRVSGDRLVWTTLDGSDAEVYTWAVGDAAPTNISESDALDDRSPEVSGDRVAWQRGDDSVYDGDVEICTWAVGDGAPTNISNRVGLWDGSPRVSGDRVVWEGWDGNDAEIFTWAVGDVAPTNISNKDGEHDWNPEVSGDRVVWLHINGGEYDDNYEVYTWAVGDAAPRNVSNDAGPTRMAWGPRVSGDRVVWRNPDWEIFTWAVGDAAATDVSNRRGWGDTEPQVSGDRIVWVAEDGPGFQDREIYTAVPSGLTVTSISGPNRYATAVDVSKTAFPAGAKNVVIATGENWPDALGGSALAGALKGPILLTRKGALPGEVTTELARLGADKAVILGSTAAVSSAVESALKAKLGASDVTRIGGANRYETARLIAAETVRLLKLADAYSGTAFATTGTNFPDALGASPLAAANGWPIYLVNPRTGVEPATIAAMKMAGVTKTVVLGDARAVSEASKNAISSGVPCTTQRIAGANRYDTAVAIANHGVLHAGLHWDELAITTGTNFPDALSGGVLQGMSGSVMLLTPSTTLNATVGGTLTVHAGAIDEVRFLGDTKAVSAGVRAAVVDVLR